METFERYRTALGRMPGDWGRVNATQEAGKVTLSEMGALLAAQTEMLRRTLRESESIRRTTEGTGLAMTRLARSTKEVAGNLISATASLLKWTGASTAITGLLGIGGLWGLDRLAVSASGMRRGSMGLNVSPGEYAGARAYQSVLGDPRAMLGNLMQSLESAAGKGVFIGAGMRPGEYEGKNAAQVLLPFLQHVQQLARTTPRGFEADILKSRGLEGVVPLELFNQLRRMRPGELEQWATMARQQQQSIRLTDDLLLKWAKLATQLDLAGNKIESILIERLAGLAEPLSHLSSAFANAVDAFLKGPAAGKLIEGMTHGLERFAEYVGKEDFIHDVERFTTGVGNMAKALAEFIEWFGSNKKNMQTVGGAAAGAAIGGAIAGPGGAAVGGAIGAGTATPEGRAAAGWGALGWLFGGVPGAIWGSFHGRNSVTGGGGGGGSGPVVGSAPIPRGGHLRPGMGGAGPQSNLGGVLSLSDMVAVAKQAGWPDAEAPQIAAIAMAESQGNTMALGRAGEHGITQILPGTTGAHRYAAEARGNALRAMQLALEIRKSEGWQAWSVYKDRSYQRYMPGGGGGDFNVQASSDFADVSGNFGVGFGYGKMVNPSGMIVHHTGGGKSIGDVLNVFKKRGVASNYVIDRQGTIYRVLPEGAAGRHIKSGWGPVGEGRSNQNMEGVEIIAADDQDVNAAEKAAALRLIKERAAFLGYDPKTSVYGHGEVNPGHRQASEGMSVVNAVRAGALNSEPQRLHFHAPHNLRITVEHDGVSPPTAVNQVAR